MSLATLRTRLVPLLGLVLFCTALWLLHEALATVRYRDVVAALSALPRWRIGAAAFLTVLGYLALTGYDVLALRYIDKPVPYRQTAVASFIAYAVGHTLGQSWLTGGTVRYRLYASWGLSAANVAAVVAFCAFTFWLGFLALGGVVFLAAPPAVPPELPLPAWTVPALGVMGLLAAGAFLGLGAVRREPVRVRGLALAVPSWPIRTGQIVVSVVDWLFASATLYVLMPDGAALSYPTFVGVYLLAIVAGIASQVPGGLGVFEGVIVLVVGRYAPAEAVLGSLVAFRAIYYLVPLGVAALLLGGYEASRAGSRLSIMLAALLPSRRYFYRKASLMSEAMTPAWLAAIGLVLAGALGLGVFAYEHVEYSHDLWWRFALQGDAPRFLRASVGVIALVSAFALWRLLRPAPPEPGPVSAEDLGRAVPIVAASRTTSAWLALPGDKSLLFSGSGRSFLMYGVEGTSFVAMGDPVGRESEAPELVRAFRELCDRHGGRPVFYQVGPHRLPLYLDLGLTLLELGEQARVPLESFSLDGGSCKGLRTHIRKLEREGAGFAVVPAAEVPALLPELREVSDDWLREKRTREKGFSVGFFEPTYLARCPVAVVRVSGRIVAFANVWLAADHEELSPDLMRHRIEAPAGVMEYLFLELMLWGKARGYRWFDLGMTPLSGPEDRTLAPLWNRVGAFLYRHGEHFYDFQGLRQYKAQFDPQREPRYLAAPNGLALPRVLTNVAALIAGGRPASC